MEGRDHVSSRYLHVCETRAPHSLTNRLPKHIKGILQHILESKFNPLVSDNVKDVFAN